VDKEGFKFKEAKKENKKTKQIEEEMGA